MRNNHLKIVKKLTKTYVFSDRVVVNAIDQSSTKSNTEHWNKKNHRIGQVPHGGKRRVVMKPL